MKRTQARRNSSSPSSAMVPPAIVKLAFLKQYTKFEIFSRVLTDSGAKCWHHSSSPARSKLLNLKARTQYACQQCGHISPKWIGRCPSCQEWNSLVEERTRCARRRRSCQVVGFDAGLFRGDHRRRRSPHANRHCGIRSRAGRRRRAGALMLLGGDPGVGKSTLMLDVASRLSAQTRVLYASGEESAQQIKMRGEPDGDCTPAICTSMPRCRSRRFSRPRRTLALGCRDHRLDPDDVQRKARDGAGQHRSGARSCIAASCSGRRRGTFRCF